MPATGRWGQGRAEPEPLVNALLDQAGAIGRLRAFSGLSWNDAAGRHVPATLRMLSYGGLGELRRLSQAAGLRWSPATIPRCRGCSPSGRLPCDVGLLQVSAPDADGQVSLGIGVEYAADAVRHTRTLIAEVNPRMPVTAGAPTLPLSGSRPPWRPTDPCARFPPANPTPSTAPSRPSRRARRRRRHRPDWCGSLRTAVLDGAAGHADLGFTPAWSPMACAT